ncbi:pikachurin-like [Trichomycterus rosablanca]|uniref:pikachurin-like n=1 Tax=Trichomycterus rosablanca TaxID=2290929 RepID=UPI002F35D593
MNRVTVILHPQHPNTPNTGCVNKVKRRVQAGLFRNQDQHHETKPQSNAVGVRRTTNRRAGWPSAPATIRLQTENCTVVRVQWRIPHRHIYTVTGYKVFYAEVRNNRPVGPPVTLDVPLSADTLTADVLIGNLKVAAQYRVSVAAFDRAGQGRPSMPRDVSTASREVCLPPSPPAAPTVVAISDTELALSWQQGQSKGGSPVLYFLVAYIR